MPDSRPWGVLLAAGASSRMGRHKLLLDLGGEPLVRRAARALLACDLAGVQVVLGRDPEQVRAALGGLDVTFVHNAAYLEGELPSSIALGVRTLPPEASGALLMLADMPFVRAEHLQRVLDAGRKERPVLSAYGDVTAPPHFVPRAAFDHLLGVIDAGAARPLKRAFGDVAALAQQPPEDLLDVDDEAAYAAARQRLQDGR